jgi:parallel beta-helix repeat protein
MSSSSQQYKELGNTEFRKKNYEQACTLYRRALESLESSKLGERAILLSNLSAVEFNRHNLEQSLQYATECIQCDSLFGKGYVRKFNVLWILNNREEAIDCVTQMMNETTKSKVNNDFISCLIEVQKKCSYFTHDRIIQSSKRYNSLKYKNNIVVVDKNGAGHYTSIATAIQHALVDTSILVRPGRYEHTHLILIGDVEIVGDGEESEVILEQNDQSPVKNVVIAVLNGDIVVRHVTLQQNIPYTPDPIHGVQIQRNGKIHLENVTMIGKEVAFMALQGGTAQLTSCTITDSQAGVIVLNGTMTLNNCHIHNITRMAIEIRQQGEVILNNCKIHDCGVSALCLHAEGKSVKMRDCEIYRGATVRKQTASVTIFSGKAILSNCNFHSNHGGIMISSGSTSRMTNNTFSNNEYGVGFYTQGNGHLKENKINSNNVGILVAQNGRGNIILENNVITDNVVDLMVPETEKQPKLIGDNHCEISSIDKDTTKTMLSFGAGRTFLNTSATKDWRKKHINNPYTEEAISHAAASCAQCAMFETPEQKYKRCGKCKAVMYCSVECQKKHWSSHKHDCISYTKTKVGKETHLYSKINDVETHHFIVIHDGGTGTLSDNSGNTMVFTNREVAMKTCQSLGWKPLGVIGMGDEKWKLFQETQKFVIMQ